MNRKPGDEWVTVSIEDLEPWDLNSIILRQYAKDELIKYLRMIRGGAWYHFRAMSKESLVRLIAEEYSTDPPKSRYTQPGFAPLKPPSEDPRP